MSCAATALTLRLCSAAARVSACTTARRALPSALPRSSMTAPVPPSLWPRPMSSIGTRYSTALTGSTGRASPRLSAAICPKPALRPARPQRRKASPSPATSTTARSSGRASRQASAWQSCCPTSTSASRTKRTQRTCSASRPRTPTSTAASSTMRATSVSRARSRSASAARRSPSLCAAPSPQPITTGRACSMTQQATRPCSPQPTMYISSTVSAAATASAAA